MHIIMCIFSDVSDESNFPHKITWVAVDWKENMDLSGQDQPSKLGSFYKRKKKVSISIEQFLFCHS